MTDLIDRAELIKSLNKVAMEHHESHVPMVEADFRKLIHDAETVDAQPVVRCKECKYWHPEMEFCGMWGEVPELLANGYCNFGERK